MSGLEKPCSHCYRQYYHEAWCPTVNTNVMEAWRFVDGKILGIDKKFLEAIGVKP